MVHDTEDPAGRAFFAFEMTGVIFLFTSYYPWHLQNVFFGDDEQVCGVSWPMLRQVLPALGMWIVAMVPTVPVYKADIRSSMSIAIHGMFAMAMFIGYPIIEGKALGWACLKSPKNAVEYFRTHPREQWWRKFFINVANNSNLDWFSPGASKHPVFGKITSGMDVATKISKVKTRNDNPVEPIKMKSITISGV